MWPDFPIIIVTGHGSDETREEAMQAGAFAFLAKPFRFDQIKDLMTNISSS
jgi:DNA-binding NtrC family response regulator